MIHDFDIEHLPFIVSASTKGKSVYMRTLFFSYFLFRPSNLQLLPEHLYLFLTGFCGLTRWWAKALNRYEYLNGYKWIVAAEAELAGIDTRSKEYPNNQSSSSLELEKEKEIDSRRKQNNYHRINYDRGGLPPSFWDSFLPQDRDYLPWRIGMKFKGRLIRAMKMSIEVFYLMGHLLGNAIQRKPQ